MKGDHLADPHHATRYCKPSCVQHGQPTVGAFEIGGNEQHLSVNWLEYFAASGNTSRTQQMQSIREAFHEKPFSLRPNGRFAVLNVGLSKRQITAAHGRSIDFLHWPEDKEESHSGVFGYGPDDLAIQLELKNLVTPEDIFPAVPSE